MKPMELILCGWGPYPGKEQIDFRPFYEKGIFLVTGPTGSGKTSIFDGIAYCLYGDTSGRGRDKGSLRSDFAAASAETYAEFRFSHRGEEYRIVRSPRYLRPKKRGEGTVLSGETAVLYRPDGTVTEGPGEVNAAVRQLLGLEYMQFKQIVMIAQGEFMEVLRSGSRERAEILRSLFDTGFYGRIQQKLTERAGKIQRGLEEADQDIGKARQLIRGEDSPGLSAALEEGRSPGEILSLLNEQQKEDKKRIRKLEQEEQTLDEGIKAAAERENLLRESQRRHQQSIEKEREAGELLEQCRERAEQCRIRLEQLPREQGVLRQRAEERIRLQGLEGRLQQAEMQEREAAAQEAKAARDLAEWNRQRDVLAEQEKKEAGILQDWQEPEQVLEQKNKADSRAEQGKRELELLTEYEADLREWNRAGSRLLQLQAEYQQAEEEKRAASEQYEKAKHAFRSGIIGLAAREVREGFPCPVCGSLEHPKIAGTEEEIPDERELKGLEQTAAAAALRYEEAFVRAADGRAAETALAEKYEGAWRQLCEIRQVLPDQKHCPEKIEREMQDCRNGLIQLEAERQALEARYRTVREQAGELEKLRRELAEGRVREGILKERAVQAAEQAERRRQEAADGENALQKELQEAGWPAPDRKLPSAEQFRQELERRKNWEQQEQERQSRIQEENHKAEQETAAQSALLKKYEEERLLCQRQWEVCRQECEAFPASAQLEQQRKEVRTKRETLSGEYLLHERAAKELKESIRKRELLESEYSVVKDLEKTAKGENPQRIVLEQYVLAAYYREVLAAANVRLYEMSGGRYELFLVERVQDARTKDSLGLEVLDYYTGRRRPVGTMSGGESFQGALALALGLSDVVQRSAGGICIETLFIDEGFGALDSQALRQAMDTILRTAAGSGKLIGIISHVEELKEQIPEQIRVRRTAAGSSISK